MNRNRPLSIPLQKVGNAGFVASAAIMVVGVLLGAISAYISELGARANAHLPIAEKEIIAYAASADAFDQERAQIVERVLTDKDYLGWSLERLKSPTVRQSENEKPKIIIIFDDMGLDREAFEKALSLPGPLTLSILPYAQDASRLAQHAAAKGREIMLHLPMEPNGDADPGPKSLNTNMSGAEFLQTLHWNLSRLEGYAGVNNHMGSKLTANAAAMKTVLAALKQRDLFFLDSVTTPESTVRRAGKRVGANVFFRDVFLDSKLGDKKAIRKQLAMVERIAQETGFAVAICHPRPETFEVLGPWLTTAPARGFELAHVSTLKEIQRQKELHAVMALAPSLRQH